MDVCVCIIWTLMISALFIFFRSFLFIPRCQQADNDLDSTTENHILDYDIMPICGARDRWVCIAYPYCSQVVLGSWCVWHGRLLLHYSATPIRDAQSYHVGTVS